MNESTQTDQDLSVYLTALTFTFDFISTHTFFAPYLIDEHKVGHKYSNLHPSHFLIQTPQLT